MADQAILELTAETALNSDDAFVVQQTSAATKATRAPLSLIASSLGFNNAIMHGADPTGVADSTVAIQAAIDAGNTTYVPAGDYLVDTLNIPEGHFIFGDGVGDMETGTGFSPANVHSGTILRHIGSPTGPIFQYPNVDPTSAIHVSRITFVSDNNPLTGDPEANGFDGINMGSTTAKLWGSSVTECGFYGFRFGIQGPQDFEIVRIGGCSFRHCYVGVFNHDGTFVSDGANVCRYCVYGIAGDMLGGIIQGWNFENCHVGIAVTRFDGVDFTLANGTARKMVIQNNAFSGSQIYRRDAMLSKDSVFKANRIAIQIPVRPSLITKGATTQIDFATDHRLLAGQPVYMVDSDLVSLDGIRTLTVATVVDVNSITIAVDTSSDGTPNPSATSFFKGLNSITGNSALATTITDNVWRTQDDEATPLKVQPGPLITFAQTGTVKYWNVSRNTFQISEQITRYIGSDGTELYNFTCHDNHVETAGIFFKNGASWVQASSFRNNFMGNMTENLVDEVGADAEVFHIQTAGTSPNFRGNTIVGNRVIADASVTADYIFEVDCKNSIVLDNEITADSATVAGHFRMRNANAGTIGVFPAVNIVAATKADPVVVTLDRPHQYTDAAEIIIEDVAGMTELNNSSGARHVNLTSDPKTIEIHTNGSGTTLDGTAFTTYTSGGVIRPYVAADTSPTSDPVGLARHNHFYES